MDSMVQRVLSEIEEHQREVVRLRGVISKIQDECTHDRTSVLTDRDLYVQCSKCGKLI